MAKAGRGYYAVGNNKLHKLLGKSVVDLVKQQAAWTGNPKTDLSVRALDRRMVNEHILTAVKHLAEAQRIVANYVGNNL